MIALAPAHHALAPGEILSDGSSEHSLMQEIVSLTVWHLGSAGLAVPSGTIKDRVDFLYRLHPTPILSLELHSCGPAQIEYNPNNEEGGSIAKYLSRALGGYGMAPGWYRGEAGRGLEFWLQQAPGAALILRIDPFSISPRDLALALLIAIDGVGDD